MKADITIILSVHNGQKFLRQAIKSILGQTYGNFIFAIVDDGSTDDSWKIISSIQDKRIAAAHENKNVGLTKRLNQMLRRTKTRFVARVDADEISFPDRLMLQRNFLLSNPNCAAVGSNIIRVDERGKKILESHFPTDYQEIKRTIFSKNPFRHGSLVFNYAKLKGVGFYDESYRYSQDYDLMLRLTAKFPVANLSETLVQDIFTKQGISQRHRLRQSVYALQAQVSALLRGDYPLANIFFLLRTVAFIIKSVFYRAQ